MVWTAILKLEAPDTIAKVQSIALWMAAIALCTKELLFRYMLAIAKRIKSSMLIANAWHARSDAASSFVVGVGIIGNLAGFPILDPIAALIVGLMILKMGWGFAWDALHDLMDRAVDEIELNAIRTTLLETPGVSGVHDLRTRKMGDMIIADAHLEVESSLTVEAGHDIAVDANRAWPTGRPVVYVVVDIWSTAVVGFYVCLNGPSWTTAKLALFSTFADPAFMAQLWGYEHIDVLSPSPAVPHTVISDRGEYLSLGARETCGQLGINFAINPAYRPDLKGLVEVLHRIAKDQQIQFLPGAIDARRKELELRTDARESVLTLREYVQFLHTTFAHYNLFADRSHRMTAEMIAAGVDPSPAGLWRFGHEVAVGYQKHIPQDRLITGLLQRRQAVSRRDGIFFESSEYKGEIAQTQEWSAVARNFGSIDKTAYHFPGSMGQFWWPDPHGVLHEFKLTENARVTPEVSLEEWRDALMYETTKSGGRQYRRLTGAINSMEKHRALRQRAIELTGQADAAYVGVKPNVRETRMFDSLDVAFEPSSPEKTEKPLVADENVNYEALMDEVFASLNREGAL